MNNASRFLHLVLVVALALPAGTAGAKGMKEVNVNSFNLSKTRTFMSEMETRPDFPVATVLANDYVYTMLALGGKIQPARQRAIVSFLKKSQQNDGSFVPDKASKTGNILFTDLALETLTLLKAADSVQGGKAKAFVASLKNADGGFGFASQSKASSLANTYYAVRILQRVKGMEVIDKTKTVAYLKLFEKKQGGFGSVMGAGEASARNTYMAAYILSTLGALEPVTAGNAVKYLRSTPYGGSKVKAMPDLDEQLYTLLALKELKADRKADRGYAMEFLKKIYVKMNGGFAPLPGYGSTPDSTTAALRVLAELGKVKMPAQVAAKK